jgi:hypothetical protein
MRRLGNQNKKPRNTTENLRGYAMPKKSETVATPRGRAENGS